MDSPDALRSAANTANAYARWADMTPAQRTEALVPAAAALAEKYERAARDMLGSDADPVDIERQADLLRRRDLAKASLRAAQARRQRRQQRQLEELAAAELEALAFEATS